MINVLYTIKDVKTDFFFEPKALKHEVEFCRALTETLKHDVMLSTYPNDFEVFEVGTFDELTGIVVPCLKSLGTIKQMISTGKVIHTGYQVNESEVTNE